MSNDDPKPPPAPAPAFTPAPAPSPPLPVHGPLDFTEARQDGTKTIPCTAVPPVGPSTVVRIPPKR